MSFDLIEDIRTLLSEGVSVSAIGLHYLRPFVETGAHPLASPSRELRQSGTGGPLWRASKLPRARPPGAPHGHILILGHGLDVAANVVLVAGGGRARSGDVAPSSGGVTGRPALSSVGVLAESARSAGTARPQVASSRLAAAAVALVRVCTRTLPRMRAGWRIRHGVPRAADSPGRAGHRVSEQTRRWSGGGAAIHG